MEAPFFGFDSRALFTGLVVLVALERGVELIVARRNLRRLLARGAVEAGAGHYRWMVLLHGSFLVAAPLEVWTQNRPFVPVLGGVVLAVVALTMALRYWVIATLDGRWTTRVVCLPGEPPVTGGPYRYLRHPNYLAVVLEIAALPLVHTAWITALLYSAANAWLLTVRVRTEEAALEAAARNAGGYGARLGDRPRWLPGAPSRAG